MFFSIFTDICNHQNTQHGTKTFSIHPVPVDLGHGSDSWPPEAIHWEMFSSLGPQKKKKTEGYTMGTPPLKGLSIGWGFGKQPWKSTASHWPPRSLGCTGCPTHHPRVISQTPQVKHLLQVAEHPATNVSASQQWLEWSGDLPFQSCPFWPTLKFLNFSWIIIIWKFTK